MIGIFNNDLDEFFCFDTFTESDYNPAEENFLNRPLPCIPEIVVGSPRLLGVLLNISCFVQSRTLHLFLTQHANALRSSRAFKWKIKVRHSVTFGLLVDAQRGNANAGQLTFLLQDTQKVDIVGEYNDLPLFRLLGEASGNQFATSMIQGRNRIIKDNATFPSTNIYFGKKRSNRN